MTLQVSVAVQDARLDSVEATIGASPFLKVYAGAAPANCASAESGTLLANVPLPADWMAAAAAGQKAGSGLPWTELSADGTGTAAHFRIYDNAGTTCHMQGSVTATGGGGDMTVDNPSLVAGQQFSVTAFTLTDANA